MGDQASDKMIGLSRDKVVLWTTSFATVKSTYYLVTE